MSLGGWWFRLGHDGRFAFIGEVGLGGSPGDGALVVTGYGGNNTSEVVSALHAGGAVPLPITGRWTVSYGALLTAIQGGTRAVLTPTTA